MFKKNVAAFGTESLKKISEIKYHSLRLLPFWVAGALSAIVSVLYAKIFHLAEETSLEIFNVCGPWIFLICPLAFFLSWFLVEFFAKDASGSGIPQLMAAIEIAQSPTQKILQKLLGLKTLIIKILSSLLAVIGGGAVGREGPTLQISGSIFYLVQKNWSFSEITNRSAFLLAGAASGLAAAFNTPLGGIVYVVEELAKSHLNTFRTGVLHSVIFAGVFTQMIMGPYLYFGYPKVEGFKFSLLFQYMTISICGALFVTLMAQTLKAIVLFRREKRKFLENTFVACCCGALFAAVILFVSAHAAGGGKELLNGLIFKSQIATFGDVIGRYVGTILTYANGGAGGIFAPTLSLGGAASSYFDSIFQFQLGPLAVLLGMTSGLAALTHSPLTSFILILEMTDRHNAIIPLMIAAIIGHGVSKIISKKSFYETVFEHLLNDLENKKDVQKT